jgi:hypothetical protein
VDLNQAFRDATLIAVTSVSASSPHAQHLLSTTAQSELRSHAVEIGGVAPQSTRALMHSVSVL